MSVMLLNPRKQQYLEEEMKYLLENNFIEPSSSSWSSLCLLVPKPDGGYRMCTDYRKVNSVTKTDTFPIPRMDDCIEKVMPFGMRNSPATFQRLINKVIADLEDWEAYIDDMIIYSETWEEHLKTICEFFKKLSEAKLTINLSKTEFGQALHIWGMSLDESAPVSTAPDFSWPFKLAVDASDVAAGAVLLQEDDEGVEHPVCYFSKKFNKNQKNYSTIGKECLALVLALQNCEVYVSSSSLPVVVYSDHNPLVLLQQLKDKNQPLLRWS
ncbi:Transposon Ty3-I Gag-Pol polyprotein [Stylophora pistillata]|uniref:Transposon Ty3-I Gag-Pol polyprotein n=1 Tax=Stylophora pistillata TaxID=50429 RepID=A0A2B4RYE1_STYPI|nr:Transposon Ty3-I Gag-Pol polyprotein [Stylophora pistillata]